MTKFARRGGQDSPDLAAAREDSRSAEDAAPTLVEVNESILRQYWRVFIKRRWVILGALAATLLAGLLMAMLSQREYAATVTVEIARQASRVVEMEDAQPQLGRDQEFYQTQYALLKSQAVALMVVRDLRLANDEGFLTDYDAGAAETIAQLNRQQRERLAVGKVMTNLEVVPVRLSGVVNVRYVSPNPQMAANVANSTAENFIEFNLARRFDASAYARRFLEGRLAQMRQRLEESERQAVGYATQQQIINIASMSRDPNVPAPELSLTAADLASMNTALAQTRAARIVAEARYNQGRGGSAAAASLQNPALNTLRQQRASLSADYQRQLTDFGPEYPIVVAMRAQLQELDRQIGTETARIGQGVSQDLSAQYQQALGAERQLASRVEELKAGLLDLRRRSIQYNIYQREVDTNRALYDALLQRYKEIGIAGGVGSNNVSIVDRATAPSSPFKPNIPLTIMLSLIIGTVLGAIAALALEQLEEAAVAPADFQQKLGVPLLGAVPKLGKDEEARDALGDRKSPLSEAYFSILTGLQFSTSHGMPRAVLVTSTQASEGKSTTSYALAQSLARLGTKVLLIDGDMRNPSLHKLFGIQNQNGLSSLLVGDGELQNLLYQTPSPNLSLLTAGTLPPNPAELLAGSALEELIDKASNTFAHIVVDGPPVLGLADAPLLSKSVEATVFVLEAGRTRATQARHALNRLSTVRAPIAGAILTKFDMASSGYGYGYGYDYSYGN